MNNSSLGWIAKVIVAICIPAGIALNGDARGSNLEGAALLPGRGICAHRGASQTHPENTLAAFAEAIRLGAHMIEFDVQRTRDGELVLMHDGTINRTTNGRGKVGEMTLAEVRRLDAGLWKGEAFRGERIPTLDEALAMMPANIWLNVHLKGDAALAEGVARRIAAHDRLHQAFLACDAKGAEAARKVDPRILICNMGGRGTAKEYARATIDLRANFIQLQAAQPIDGKAIDSLKQSGVRINYCCLAEPKRLGELFDAGIEFVLVDDVAKMLDAAEELGVERLAATSRAGEER
jgi:glycerophosphoryl diester phosphodiesterase